jgi:hypothetical protein
MGRPLTYDDDARARIIAALERRTSLRDAVAIAGVAWPTFNRWLSAGRAYLDDPTSEGADERFAKLARDVEQANAETDGALAGLLYRAATGLPAQPASEGIPAQPAIPGDWRAADALLKIRADAEKRRAEVKRIKAETKVALMRADGTLPADKLEVKGLAEFLSAAFPDGPGESPKPS